MIFKPYLVKRNKNRYTVENMNLVIVAVKRESQAVTRNFNIGGNDSVNVDGHLVVDNQIAYSHGGLCVFCNVSVFAFYGAFCYSRIRGRVNSEVFF